MPLPVQFSKLNTYFENPCRHVFTTSIFPIHYSEVLPTLETMAPTGSGDAVTEESNHYLKPPVPAIRITATDHAESKDTTNPGIVALQAQLQTLRDELAKNNTANKQNADEAEQDRYEKQKEELRAAEKCKQLAKDVEFKLNDLKARTGWKWSYTAGYKDDVKTKTLCHSAILRCKDYFVGQDKEKQDLILETLHATAEMSLKEVKSLLKKEIRLFERLQQLEGICSLAVL